MRDSVSKPIKKACIVGDFYNPVPAYARKADVVEVCSSCGGPLNGRYRTVFTDPIRRICRVCDHPPTRPTSTFPFTTSHFDGKPREITSLSQLRKLEAQFGVRCAPYNMDEKNMAEAPHYGKEQIKGSELRGHRGAAPRELRESITVR